MGSRSPALAGLLAALVAALAAVASSTGSGGGYAEFFTVLSVAAVVVTGCVAVRRTGSVEVARAIALAWDAVAAWAAILLSGFGGRPASPPAGPDELFLGVPLVAYHVLAAFGGALLVTYAAFASPRTLRVTVSRREPT